MFIEDFRKDFYHIIAGKRVLILSNFDVDALCGVKILQCLFRCDDILYTLVPVRGLSDLEKAYRENSDQIEFVVFVNCGGTVDLVETLQPDDHVIFFIADNHRPTHVCNIYNDGQVRLLMKPQDDELIPPFEDLFRDDESEDEGGSDSDDQSLKRPRFDEAAIERRREKRLWEERRQKIMFDYLQFSYYGSSSAVIFYELAWKMSKDNNDLLWWAIVGFTEGFLFNKIETQQYILDSGSLQTHVSRLNHHSGADAEDSVRNSIKIAFEKELNLSLYRHWSMEQSIRHTRYTACRFKLWTLKGEKRLYEFLADLGLPLVQCRQKFTAMDVTLRTEIKQIIEGKCEKYELDNIVYGSFNIQHGFRNRFSATDVVHGCVALMESSDKDKLYTDMYLDALDCLSRSNITILERGIEEGKKQLAAIFKQVQSFLDMNQIVGAGPFLYTVIHEGAVDTRYFRHPHCLILLAKFTLEAHVAVSRSRKSRTLPLVLSAPSVTDDGMCLIVGVPPVLEKSSKNFFGKAFAQAAEKTNSRAIFDFFDTSVIQLHTEDRSKFCDALISMLS